ncbi:MAG TPA: UbiA family prenyltransferase [Thermoanaerobaculia bacterium]|nr:UbiA family prenyltransferase [Thermoanaerobaculia bacterium]
MIGRACRRLRRGLLVVDRVVRLRLLLFSGLLPLLGAATVRRDLSAGQIAALLGVSLCFHVYSYVLNDVIDLPIDRTQPLRQEDLLVRGAIRPWQALLLALAGIPLSIPLTLGLGGSGRALATLALGFALMAIYNLWGKRCAVPPVTDAVQGLAWGSLVLYAALALGGEPNRLTWIVVAYCIGLILLINGFHGPLRDLDNDLASGARTTAIFLGVRPSPGGAVRVPWVVPVFAYAIQASLVALDLVPLLRNDLGYGPATRIAMLGIVGALDLAALLLLSPALAPERPEWQMAWRLQLFLVVVTLPVLFVPYVSAPIRYALLLLVAITLLLLRLTYTIAGLLVRRVRSALRLRGGPLSTPARPR